MLLPQKSTPRIPKFQVCRGHLRFVFIMLHQQNVLCFQPIHPLTSPFELIS